jgi:mitofilin
VDQGEAGPSAEDERSPRFTTQLCWWCWENERERFKNIIDDRDNQITQLKIEGDVARSQLSSLRKECDEIKLKLMDYEKMSKFQKAATADTSAITVLEEKLADAKKQISNAERDHRSEVNNMKMKYDGKIAVMSEEIASMKTQATKYRREREHYKEMLENAQKTRSGRTSGGDEVSEYKNKVSDLHYQIHAMEDDLAESKLDASKANAQATAQKSTFEIQISELNSKINELEEEALIESGRARIAGTRTKMELAWQKERESQKKLINELNTMARDLKSTLLEVEKERDREKLE